MASAAKEAPLSDVDWLVMRARSFPKSDPYSAKAWLITAKSLFPQSFVIQFESYLVEKSAKNVEEAARHLQDMLQCFPSEPRLWAEVQNILESLQKESQDLKVTFLTDLFAAIPTTTQCQMLLHVSETISDVLERCQLLLLAMKKFPNLVQEHGLKLVEMLVTEETNSGIVNNPVNCYRKLLVCDVMPLVLQRGHVEVNMFHLLIWLERAIEFYVSYLSQPTSTIDAGGDREAGKSHRGISGLSEADIVIGDPWGGLIKLLLLIGQELEWDIERDLIGKSRDYQVQSLQHQLTRARAGGADANNKQVFYTALVLFVYSLINYISHVDTESTASGCSHQIPVALLETINISKSESHTVPKSKKMKTESFQSVSIHPSSSINSASAILQYFDTAMKCMELLTATEDMKLHFYNLCQKWRKETKTMMTHFETDMYLYQGNFKEAISHLQDHENSVPKKMKTRLSLQLACCYFSLKQCPKAIEIAMGLLESLPQPVGNSHVTLTTDDSGQEKQDHNSSAERVLQLIPCSDTEVYHYCLQLLIRALKDKAFSSQRTDVALAHLIILLQYDWPKQESLFVEVITIMQKQGTFTYNTFFSYVHQVDILEEFAFLDTAEGGKVNLDIMPVSTKAIAQQRTVTRGVNKGVKEDFKASLERQVAQTPEPTDVVIHRFLLEEKDEILKSCS